MGIPYNSMELFFHWWENHLWMWWKLPCLITKDEVTIQSIHIIWLNKVIFHEPELRPSGDDSPIKNHDFQGSVSSEVVMKFTQILLDEAWGRGIPKGCTSSASNSSGRPCLEMNYGREMVLILGNVGDSHQIPILKAFYGMFFIHVQDLEKY